MTRINGLPPTPLQPPASRPQTANRNPVDQVILGFTPTVEKPVVLPPAPRHQEDDKEILEAARGSALGTEPAFATVEQRWPHVPAEVRDAAGLHLLDLITEPDAGRSRRGLQELAEGMTWAQCFKSPSRQAALEGGMPAVIARAQDQRASRPPTTPLDEVLQSPTLLKQGRLGDVHVQEANRLLQQLHAGNDNPGIGSKSLGKGVSYLRGREGTRIFYRMQDGSPQFLAVVTKADEPAAISMLRDRFGLR
ncbi:MAG: hypothetical protein ACYCW6_22320 [Candidatus Xenobia bacterium]